MIVDRVLTKDGATAFPGSLVALRFQRKKLQAFFVADGSPMDATTINFNFSHSLEVEPVPRVSLWFNIVTDAASIIEPAVEP